MRAAMVWRGLRAAVELKGEVDKGEETVDTGECFYYVTNGAGT